PPRSPPFPYTTLFRSGQRLEQRLVVRLAAGQSPARRQVIAQLADQHGGRLLAVVTHAAADPADIQLLAGGEQRFQQQVAVVLARSEEHTSELQSRENL